nr:uncharacterized protein LOC116766508 isoform X1 [Danaus plexippus plexippus]
MKVENRSSTEIHTTPAATTVDVINEIRPIILGGSDVLLPGNISIELIKVSTEPISYNKIEVEKHIPTETPLLFHSTADATADANEPYSDLNILDFPMKPESRKGGMSFSSSLGTTASTNFFTSNTLSNELTIYPLALSENKHKVLPANNTKTLETSQNGLKLKEPVSIIIEKRDKNEIESLRDNLTFTNGDNLTKFLIENPLIKESTVNLTKIKSIQDSMLVTRKGETTVDGLLSITTPLAVQQHVSKPNTDVSTEPKALQLKEPRFPLSLSYSEKNNPSDNATFSTNLEKPMILSNVTTSSNASDLNGSFDFISTYLHNESVRSIDADNLKIYKNQNIIKKSTEIYDSFNEDWSDTTTEIIKKTTTMGKNFSETGPSKNFINIYNVRFPNINIKDSSTFPLKVSNDFKSSSINVDMTTEYRLTSKSNENQNVTQYEKDVILTIDSLTPINSNVSTLDHVLADTTKTSTFDNIFKVANFTKSITETKRVVKVPISINDKIFEEQNIIEKNRNITTVTEGKNPESYYVEEKLFPVEIISGWENNGTEKNILTSVTGSYQSSFKSYFTNVTNSAQRFFTEEISTATIANDYSARGKFHENEYNTEQSVNGQLLTQVEGLNVEYSNKTVNLSLNSNTTKAVKEKDYLYNSPDSPTTNSNNKMIDRNSKKKLDSFNNVKYDTMQNKSIFADVIDRNEIINQSNSSNTNNSSDFFFKYSSKIQTSLPEINETYKLDRHNESSDHRALNASYYDHLKNTGNANTNDNKLLLSSVSKTSLSKDVTDTLSPSIDESLSGKTFVETQTTGTSLPYSESTLNYLDTEKFSADSINLGLDVNSTRTSTTKEKLIHSDLIDSLATTHFYYKATTKPTINKVTKIINENKTNIISKSTDRTEQPNDYTGVIKIVPEFVCVQRGKYSDRFNCNKFYLCIGLPKPLIRVCPPNTVFSEFLKQCTKNVAHCIRNNQFKCTTNGRFNNILSNNSYFICVKKNNGFIRFTLQCQKGYYLDKRNTKCTQESLSMSKSEENNSKNTKEVSVEKSKEGFAKKDYFECEREGKFEDPENCRKYYVCKKARNSTFRRKIKACDSDEVFHKKKGKCVDEESYECNI